MMNANEVAVDLVDVDDDEDEPPIAINTTSTGAD